MTGDELFDFLQKLTAEQRRKFEVVIEGENRFRNKIFNSVQSARIAAVNEDGKERDGEPSYICLEKI